MTRREGLNKRLEGIRFSEDYNAGLWLDKFICNSQREAKSSWSKDETAKAELVRQITKINESEIYNDYFHKVWFPNLDIFGAECRKAKVKNRLAINLGSESVLETSISLHRVFGVPFIAGSSLKGMTAAFIRQYGDWKKDGDFYITIFGDENNAGFITFYDALYVPDTGFPDKDKIKRPLYADVMTTHHQDYYSEKKENNRMLPPADWDNPNPVPFVSATGEYLIALSAPEGCKDWITLTFDILGFALATEGIGAKTSSGYGRLKLQDEHGNYTDKYEIKNSARSNPSENDVKAASQNQPVSESERIAKNLIQRVNALRNNDVAGRIPGIAQECLAIEDETAKKQVAAAIRQKVITAKRENASKGKKWFEDIIIFTEDAEWIVEPKR